MVVIFVVLVCLGLTAAEFSVSLEEVSTVFLPIGTREWDVPVVEDGSFDSERKLLYVVGGRYRHAIDYTVPSSPSVMEKKKNDISNSEITDISVCGEYFIQTTDNKDEKSKGTIEIYKQSTATREAERLYIKEVGEDPDSAIFLPGCKEAVVSVQGSAYSDKGTFKDPKGKVIFVQLPAAGYSGSFQDNVKLVTLNFTTFDSKVADLLRNGARHVYTLNGNPFSNDVDPGSLTMSPDGKKIFVSLQVTNAVAVVDVKTKTVTHVHGLGMKNWRNLSMDASDKDGGIRMMKWPIYSYYLPDDIGFMRHAGKNYIVTANEGNDYDYSDFNSFKEEKVGKDFIKDGLVASSVSSDLKAWLANDTNLGRLRFTTVNGEGTTNAYTKFVAFGGRSFSIWDANSMDLVYDSGDDLEKRHAQMQPSLFNGDVDGDHTPKEDADGNSDKRGPEPESIAIGSIGSLGLIFVGVEAPGTVCVYSVLDDVKKPRFEYMWQGVKDTNVKWKTLFDNKNMKGVDPEYIRFLDAKESPTKKPAIIVIGAVSNTVTLLNVKITGTIPSTSNTGNFKINTLLLAISFVMKVIF